MIYLYFSISKECIMKRRRPIKHRPTRWEKDQSIHMTYLKEGLSQSLREDVQVMTFGKYKGSE